MDTSITTSTAPPISRNLTTNIAHLKEIIPLDKSFDIIFSELKIGENACFFVGLNGYIEEDILQRIFRDLKDPIDTSDRKNVLTYLYDHVGYASVSLYPDFDGLITSLLSGTALLLLDGFNEGISLDIRTYPTRGIAEPDTEPVTRGAKDGFTEIMLTNANLIRRRIRAADLTFEAMHIGSISKTEVSIGYLNSNVDEEFLSLIRKKLQTLRVSSLTMGTKSLEELLLKKSFFHPLPSMFTTERPDVACSYLMEGHILLLVDNAPSVIVLPTSLFLCIHSWTLT